MGVWFSSLVTMLTADHGKKTRTMEGNGVGRRGDDVFLVSVLATVDISYRYVFSARYALLSAAAITGDYSK